VIYNSKRVGAGYRIFDFYKFRSMRSDADKMLHEIAGLNQYANESDKKDGKPSFVKFKNDPRITKFGSFLRKTSIDELPQLFNVLIGDMSLVGNRPLPLYEAEQLTTNEWSTRFLGPAGLTGLWQISKRGKQDMSETERKELDNYYATNYSVFLDLKIIIKTIPALFQKENV
jgi:lipopolysaccharide/colanic/teichoic acid biosynthesis glycosyltransferase